MPAGRRLCKFNLFKIFAVLKCCILHFLVTVDISARLTGFYRCIDVWLYLVNMTV